MARPKETNGVSIAFLEKSSKEESRLRQKVASSLCSDVSRLYKESIHSDLSITSGTRTYHLHKAVLQARLKNSYNSVLESLQSSKLQNDELDEILCDFYSTDEHQVKHALKRLSYESHTNSGEDNKENLEHTAPQVCHDEQNNDEKPQGKDNCSLKFTAYNGDPCSDVGADLLQLYLHGKCSDIILSVEGYEFHVHKSILSARSVYFDAMLAHGWKESEKNMIKLDGVNKDTIDCALGYIYGGTIKVTCGLQKYLHMADMYGMDGLREVVVFLLKRDMCHYFHKPCVSCSEGVVDSLTLSHMYDLVDLHDRCIKWINKNLARIWKTKAFLSSPEEVVQKCLVMAEKDLSHTTVIDKIIDCDKVMANATPTTTNQRSVMLASQLMDSCIDFVRNNFVDVLSSSQFMSLADNMTWSLTLMENVIGRAVMSLPLDKACEAYQVLHKLKEYCDNELLCSWAEEFKDLIKSLFQQCGHFMVLNVNQIHNSTQWNMLPADLQKEVRDKASYVYIGEHSRIRAQPPKLSSATSRRHQPKTPSVQSGLTSNKKSLRDSTLPKIIKHNVSNKTGRRKSTNVDDTTRNPSSAVQPEQRYECINEHFRRIVRTDSQDDSESVLSLLVNTSMDKGPTFSPDPENSLFNEGSRAGVNFSFEVLPVFSVAFTKPL